MSTVRTDSRLRWGHRYLMVEPDHFRVDYPINPFMHLDDQPDPSRTSSGWPIIAAIEAAGGRRRGPPAAARRARHGLRDEPRTGPR